MSNRLHNLRLNLDGHGIYADPRTTGPELDRTRNVRFYRATASGGGAIAKNEDGRMCAVTGKESLRIISVHDGSYNTAPGHKSSVGKGGYRIDASRNYWEGSGLKIDCASTDVAWGCGAYSNKILTSARNGELILWDINKTEASKFERKCRDHIRSINALCVSHVVHHYCITGSSDGDLRVWDLRTFDRSILRVHHPAAVRSLAFSPSIGYPLYAIVGQDNGSIWRWDLKMGQRGCLDRLPVAHSGSVTSLAWCNRLPTSYGHAHLHPPLAIPTPSNSHFHSHAHPGSSSNANPSHLSLSGGPDGNLTYAYGSGGSAVDRERFSDTAPNNGLGWLASGGLDRCVKVWDLTSSGPAEGAGERGERGVGGGGKMYHRPTYILHPSFPVRRVVWRPEYECELAVVSNAEFTPGSNLELQQGQSMGTGGRTPGGVEPGAGTGVNAASGGTRSSLSEVLSLRSALAGALPSPLPGSGFGTESWLGGPATTLGPVTAGDAVEIWDVRRGWIAKWSVTGSAAEGSVTDVEFGDDSDVVWTQHSSGTFSQIDLRDCTKPIDSINRSATTWEVNGSLTFVANSVTKHSGWGIPYDDIPPDKRPHAERYGVKLKAIGDPQYTPRGEQDVGTLLPEDADNSVDVFERLAKGYVIPGDDDRKGNRNDMDPAQSKRDRVEVCKINAQVAFDAKQSQLAQTWLLLGASLSELTAPPAPTKKSTQKPITRVDTPAQGSSQSPPLIPSNYTFPQPSSGSQANVPSQLRKVSPSGAHHVSAHASAPVIPPPPPARSTSNSMSRSRRMTPASSTQSSPRQLPAALPPTVPSITPRRPSIFSGPWSSDYSSGDPDFTRRPSLSLYRRPSLSMHGSHSLSPAEKASNAGGGGSSLRHVGEGALDDSDSDEDEGSVNGGGAMDDEGGEASTDGLNGAATVSSSLFQQVTSPVLHNMRSMVNAPTPSPLSRVAGKQRWSFDEASQRGGEGNQEEDDWAPKGHGDESSSTSPSPHSSDNEAEFEADTDENDDSEGVGRPAYARTPNRARSSSISKRPTAQRPRSGRRTRPRRSSTVALLSAAGTTPAAGSRALPALTRQESESSIRTVLAADASNHEPAPSRSVAVEETIRDFKELDRRRSIPFSDFALDGTGSMTMTAIGNRGTSVHKGSFANGGAEERGGKDELEDLTERRIEIVRADEKRFRDLAFAALREALENYADEGDVQMCAMLSLTAPQELDIPQARIRRFLDCYIDLLQRRRLYAHAAHVRKFCSIETIRRSTLVETIIYTACGRCKKAIVVPGGSRLNGNISKGSGAYCGKCQSYVARCVICRLPIRTLLLQCSICHHGAHQECYRDYHQQKPPVNISASRAPGSVRNDRPKCGQSTNPQHLVSFRDEVDGRVFQTLGRLCAGGCGHYCWLSMVQIR